MRKKLMSCVVALAFMMSIGLNAGFAAPSSTGEETSNSGGSSSILTDEGTKNAYVAPSDEYVDGVVGRITRVFNYSAGIMTSFMDANFNITVLDNGRQRATFGYNFENGTYTMTSFNLYGTDFGKISEYGEGAAAIKAFLLDIGFTETQLTTEKAKYDKDGNFVPKTTEDAVREETDVAWLQIAYDTLASGVNYSCSINTVAAGGSTLTTIVNGQPDKVYAAQPDKDGNVVVTQKYNYENGFLKSIATLAYEVDLEDLKKQEGYDNLVESGVIDPKQEVYQYSTEQELRDAMENQGTGSVKYNPVWNVTVMNAYGQQAYTTNSNGTVLGVFSYGSNGAINAYKDLTTNTTTQYVNGNPAQVINDKGYVTQTYMYNANGTMSGAATYVDGVMTTLTAFRMGKALATADLSKGQPATIQSIMAAYDAITQPGKSVDEINKIVEANALTNIQMYAGHLLNKNLLIALGFGIDEEIAKLQEQADAIAGKMSDEEYQKLVNAVEAYNNATTSAAKETALNTILTGSYGGTLGNIIAQLKKLGVTTAAEIRGYLEDAVRYAELKGKVENGGTLSSEINEGDKESDKDFYANYSNQSTDVARYITQLINVFNKIINLSPESRKKQVDDLQLARDTMFEKNNGYSAVASITPTINTTEEAINSTSTTKVTNGSGQDVTSAANRYKTSEGDGYSGDAVKATETTTTTTTMKKTTKLNYTVTVFDRGAAAFEIKGAEHILNESTYDKVSTSDRSITYDPVIIGQQGGFVGANGEPLVNADGTLMTKEQMADIATMSNEQILALIAANGGAIYVSVGANLVNIMDGAGFQAAEGEEFLVQVTDADAIRQLAANIGQEVMLMGDVRTNVAGKKTIEMMTAYGGGYKMGSDIASTRDLIDGITNGSITADTASEWIMNNLTDNAWLQAEGKYGNDWAMGWKLLVAQYEGGRSQVEQVLQGSRAQF